MALRPDPRAGRPVLPYDDISLPYDDAPTSGPSGTSQAHPSGPQASPPQNNQQDGKPPPAKKRKGNRNKNRQQQQQHQQHWDDPGAAVNANGNAGVVGFNSGAPAGPSKGGQGGQQAQRAQKNASVQDHSNAQGGPSTTQNHSAPNQKNVSFSIVAPQEVEEVEESRELTYEEIWDDSALIDAWDAANKEYEAHHGKGKSWKTEGARKSVLWYNIPPEPKPAPAVGGGGLAGQAIAQAMAMQERQMNGVVSLDGQQEDGEQEEYDTYEEGNEGVAQATMPPDLGAYHGKGVGQDEAFSRAMNAMYWTGYWTAVYHASQNGPRGTKRSAQEMQEVEEELDGQTGDDEEAMEEDGFVSSQR
ncbi:hypothetical protein EV121DRAFT_284218 [Schizophyllum commune]